MKKNGQAGAQNGSPKGAAAPAGGFEAVALEPDQYDEFRAQLSSDSDGETEQLAAFFAKSERIYR